MKPFQTQTSKLSYYQWNSKPPMINASASYNYLQWILMNINNEVFWKINIEAFHLSVILEQLKHLTQQFLTFFFLSLIFQKLYFFKFFKNCIFSKFSNNSNLNYSASIIARVDSMDSISVDWSWFHIQYLKVNFDSSLNPDIIVGNNIMHSKWVTSFFTER